MDPITTLSKLREIVNLIYSSSASFRTYPSTPDEWTDLCEDFAEYFDALDSWLNKQGFSPWPPSTAAGSTQHPSVASGRLHLRTLRTLTTQINGSPSTTLNYEDTADTLASAFASLDALLCATPANLRAIWGNQ